MKVKVVAAVLASAGLLVSGVSLAQGSGPNRGGSQGPQNFQNNGQGPGNGGQRGGPNGSGGPGREGPGGPGGPGGGSGFAERGGPAGPVPHAQWRKGGRVPGEYRGRNYVVDDWDAHHLNRPPRGYEWVGVNGDYVLVALASGVIAQIITGGR